MTKLVSTLRPLLAMTLFASALSCGGDPDVPEPGDIAVEQEQLAATYTFACLAPGTGFGAFALPPGFGLPFIPLTSLATVPNPVLGVDLKTGGWALRGDLAPYVADVNAAIQLGKALFWDVQAGSDNSVACATCHFQAGGDVRTRNQVHPGANGQFDGMPANYALSAADYPFTDPALQRDVDNAAGSQGVRRSVFGSISSTGAELTTPVVDPVFGRMRRTTGLNTPPAVNAVFNHRNFFNGRAQPEFNGVNPWGARDSAARVWRVVDTLGNVGQIDIRILNASLASQAVGPPLNDVEMSATGRTFPELGKKLLLVKPLGLQKVDAGDSVLGGIADRRGKGLRTTYAALIQKAFQPAWWNTTKRVTQGTKNYSLAEANFSMFWGLSIMLYEATLVANQSPMDLYVASRTLDPNGLTLTHNPGLLDPVVNRLAAEGIRIPLATGGSRAVTRADILLGLDLFEKPLPVPGTVGIPPGEGVGCAFCHVGAETTSASVAGLTGHGVEPGDVALRNAGFDLRMERMFMGIRQPPPTPPQPPPPVPLGTDVITFDSGTYAVNVIGISGVAVAPQPAPVNVYDTGWYNIGVRPTADDPGLGGTDPLGRPLSWTEFYQRLGVPIKVVGGGLGCVDANGNPVVPPAAPLASAFAGEVLNPATGLPLLAGPLLPNEKTDVAGSFKTSALRNVELSGPYFHNGGKATLRQAVELYDDGGNFANATLSPLIRPLGMTPDQVSALVAFLVSLTDERVLYQRAPFDHPELPLPAGQDAAGNDLVTVFPAVGAAGSAPLPRFLGLNPFQ